MKKLKFTAIFFIFNPTKIALDQKEFIDASVFWSELLRTNPNYNKFYSKNFSKNKTTKDAEKKQLQQLMSDYKEYADLRESVEKNKYDTTGKVIDQSQAKMIEDMESMSKKLMEKYGIDVSSEANLFNSLLENNILTQEQMNALLDEDIARRSKINSIIRQASDAESTSAKKEQEKQGVLVFKVRKI